MEYKVYCLIKNQELKNYGGVVKADVDASSLTEALSTAKEKFLSKFKKQKHFQIFMYESKNK